MSADPTRDTTPHADLSSLAAVSIAAPCAVGRSSSGAEPAFSLRLSYVMVTENFLTEKEKRARAQEEQAEASQAATDRRSMRPPSGQSET
jgi:hypothetical protein